MKLFNDIVDMDVFDKSEPIYTLGTFNTYNGISIFPLFDKNDSKAIRMRYLQMPIALSTDTSVPKLPLNHQAFLFWRAVEEGAIARKDTGLAQYANQKYEQGRARLMASFKPLRDLKPKRDIQSHYKLIKTRDY